MEGRIKYFLQVSFNILTVCYFGTVGPSSLPTTVGTSSVPSTVGPFTVPSKAGPSSVPKTVRPSSGSETCASLDYDNNVRNDAFFSCHVYNYNYAWHNISFWGGHLQIPWKENLDDTCSYWAGRYFLTLSDKHKDIADIGEDILTSDACILNQNQADNCILDVSVEMRKCYGHLLFRFPWNLNHSTYICFEREYTDTCESSDFVYTAGNMSGRFLKVWNGDIQLGWFDAHRDGKQYVLPSFEDVDDVFENCFPEYASYSSFFLKEGMPQDIGEDPVRLRLCYVYKNYYDNYDNYNEYEDYYFSDKFCCWYIYARKCHGKIQFDLPQYFTEYFCLISSGGDNAGLATSTLVAVITGSVFAGIILTTLVVYVRCYKRSKKLRTVEDIQSSQAYMSHEPATKNLGVEVDVY